MTHAGLVQRAVRWLRGPRGCSVVFAEMVSASSETPDAIGWKAGFSTLVECKVSRSDFLIAPDRRDEHPHLAARVDRVARYRVLRDAKKPRRRLNGGMGYQRFFLAQPGVIEPDKLPDGWGLLIAHERRIVVAQIGVRYDHEKARWEPLPIRLRPGRPAPDHWMAL